MTLYTLRPGETRQIIFSAASQRVQTITNYTIANLDETGTIYVGPADADRQAPDLASSGAASQLTALQSIAVSNHQDWYAFNPSGGIFNNVFGNVFTGAPITVDIIPNCNYWAPSPYQAALSLVDQGLMKDSTGQTGNSNTSSIMTNTSNALSVGVPPAVPNIATNVQSFKSPGTYTIHTMSAAGRLWMASCTGSYEGNAGYGGGLVNTSVSITTAGGLTLSLIELAVTVANQITNDTSVVPWNGIPLANGEVIQLVVGSAPAGTVVRGSGFAAWSIP